MLKGLNNSLSWVDDILAYAKDGKSFVIALREILQRCRDYGIFLSAKKCKLWLTEATWLGRTVSERGISFTEDQLSALRDMSKPLTAADLQQFLCGAQWFRSTIPNYAAIFQPLQNLLKDLTREVKSSKKVQLRKISLKGRWLPDHDTAYSDAKKALENSVTISYLQPGGTVSLFTDASSVAWGVIVTQVMSWNHTQSIAEQDHRLLGVASGVFAGKDLLRDIKEKEGYAINQAVLLFSYILERPEGFHLYTDHYNLTFLMNPTQFIATMNKNTMEKIARWCARLFSLKFTMHAIPGDENVWADMLSRWGAQLINADSQLLATLTTDKFFPENSKGYKSFHSLHLFTEETEMQFPSAEFVKSKQSDNELSATLDGAEYDNNSGLYMVGTRIWIPDDAMEIQICICIVAHCAGAGHLRYELTFENISKFYYWCSMREVIKKFCKSCLQCQLFNGNKMILRPYGEQLKATRCNEILQMDFLYIKEHEYVLVLMDRFSGFCKLSFETEATADAALRAILKWNALFGIASIWLTDNGSHFKNELMQKAASMFLTVHHFTAPYCPWSNGSVERVNRSILNILRKLMSEFRTTPSEWNIYLPIINRVLNERSHSTRGNYSPREIFTGQVPRTAVEIIYEQSVGCITLSSTKINSIQDYVEDLQQRLAELHMVVDDAQQAEVSKRVNSKLLLPIFEKGSYVLIATVVEHLPSKLKARWNGPYQIIDAVSTHVYCVQHCYLAENEQLVHIARMKLFIGTVIPNSTTCITQSAYDSSTYTYEKFVDIDNNERGLVLLVKWLGFQDNENTWETLSSCYDHNPELVKQFIMSLPPTPKKKQAILWLNKK
jgi:hypothetical protein